MPRDPKFWDGGLSVIAKLIDELEALDAGGLIMATPTDREKNRFSARAKRYANVGSKSAAWPRAWRARACSACRRTAPPMRSGSPPRSAA